MSKIILFDIDKTLFNVGYWFHELWLPALAVQPHIGLAELQMVSKALGQQLVEGSSFDPEIYCQAMAEKLSQPLTLIRSLFYDQPAFQAAVYPDVVPTLTALTSAWTLGIFSEGVPTWQAEKLRLCGLEQFFIDPDVVFLAQQKTTAEALARLPSSVVVDDKLTVIESLASQDKFQPIWLQREVESQIAPKGPITVITTLTELLTLQSNEETG